MIRFLIFLIPVGMWAQPFFLGVRYDTMDPVGVCVSRSILVWNYANGKLWACSSGTWANITGSGGAVGTVTSVSFTGGLITVANATTTPALTVAGTSGGIPYFSSASTWASSAALGANLPVIGGGAGSAPSVGTRSGNTTTFVTTTGTQTSGDCVKIDASGNHIANGSACNTTGTISSATTGQGAVYTAATTIGGSGDGATWTACSYANGWSDFGSSYQPCQYQKDAFGTIWVRGVLKAGTLTAGTTIMNMPAGYRPVTLSAIGVFGGVSGGAYSPAQFDFQTGGAVVQQSFGGTFAAAGAWLVNLTFSTH